MGGAILCGSNKPPYSAHLNFTSVHRLDSDLDRAAITLGDGITAMYSRPYKLPEKAVC